ncbi:hypothetical protein M513_13846 [Trichuris suis]|uniref:Secreted protein n=1 Tax=Trichuris suis TaxID=68888 RepID=A0A085LJY1_9BILA|nr:hypothetical protein M513_13846 [Trichuris suis]
MTLLSRSSWSRHQFLWLLTMCSYELTVMHWVPVGSSFAMCSYELTVMHWVPVGSRVPGAGWLIGSLVSRREGGAGCSPIRLAVVVE